MHRAMTGSEQTDSLADVIHDLGMERDELVEGFILESVRRRMGLPETSFRVDRFELRELLGAGGMGTVYAADDPHLERKVALKLLRMPGPEGAARGLREARALARLSHPNVVTVYESGIHEGRVFVAMELVEGQTLRQWLGTPRSWREICAVMLAAGRGLAAAHAVGIVHRDFKPDNVLVGDRVRVADFGLARDVSGESRVTSAEGSSHTGPRHSGTFAFMAPEQLRGGAVDARADQFAFCATWYLALDGEPPFRSDTTEQRLEAMARGLPLGTPAGVPRWLRALLARGLHASPEQRFDRLDNLLDALERHLRPRRWVGAAAAMLAVAAASAITWWSANAREAECLAAAHAIDEVWSPARRDAVATAFEATGKPYAAHALGVVETSLDHYAAGWASARVDACRAEQAGRAAPLVVGCLERRRGELGALLTELEIADADVVQRASQVVSALRPPSECTHPDALDDLSTLDDDAKARLAVIHTELDRAWALSLVGRYQQARDVVEPSIPELRTIGYGATLADALMQRGQLQIRLGEHEEAYGSLREALGLGLAARADRIVAYAALGLSDDLTALGEHVRAHEAAELAAVMHERLTGERVWPMLVNVEGAALLQQHRDVEAVEVLAKGIAACDEDDPHDLFVLTSLYGNQAHALFRLGRLDEAEVAIERAQAVARRSIGDDHPMLAIMMLTSASIRDSRGETKEALEVQRRALEIWQRAVPEPTPVTASLLYNLGVMTLSLERHEDALAIMREALALWEGLVPPGHPDLAAANTGIGYALREMGAHAEALEHHERALAILEHEVEQAEPIAGDPLLQAARTALAAGQRERADAWIEQGLRIYAKTPNPVMEGQFRFHRARSLAEAGEPQRAEREARAALEQLRGAHELEIREVEAWLAARAPGPGEPSASGSP